MGGNTSTHVANAYSQPIYAMVDAERRRLTESASSVNASVGVDGISVGCGGSSESKYDINIIQAGFSKILPGNYLRFDVDCSGTDTAYVSVFYVNTTTGKPGWICDALARQEDKSVIITEGGQLVDAKYGSIWQREH